MEFLLHYTPILYFTQSFWRDEAFSVLLAIRPLSEALKLTFEPPLYYFGLHFWILLFGTTEIAVRSFSLLAHVITTYILIIWGEKLFKKNWLSWYLPVFFFLNPMLLYYAFEARAYALYVLFAVASLFCYSEKKWALFIASTTLGLYTHAYMVFVPFVIALHFALSNYRAFSKHNLNKYIHNPFIKSLTAIFILFTPWLIKLSGDIPKLKQSWYFPVDFHLIKSVLANIFVGFEGTPDFLWPTTAKLSALLFCIFVFALLSRKNLKRNLLYFLLVFFPLTVVLGISYFKPLFVNRYVIPSVIAQVFLIVFALENIQNSMLRKISGGIILVSTILFTFWYPAYNKKPDVRKNLLQVRALAGSQDVIMVDDALLLYEAMYYLPKTTTIYWYNPKNYGFPWYIGDTIYSTSQSINSIPLYPKRAFIVRIDGTYDISYGSVITNSATKKVIDK